MTGRRLSRIHQSQRTLEKLLDFITEMDKVVGAIAHIGECLCIESCSAKKLHRGGGALWTCEKDSSDLILYERMQSGC